MNVGGQYDRRRFGRSIRHRSSPVRRSNATRYAVSGPFASWSPLTITVSLYRTGGLLNPWTEWNSPGDFSQTLLPAKS